MIPSNLDVTESSTPIGRSRIERGDARADLKTTRINE
jgi:hypothetical protein